MENKKRKSSTWKQFSAALGRMRAAKIWQKFLDDEYSEDVENFLFLSVGDQIVIRGMHYPKSDFFAGAGPVIFETAEENVYIAAWSQDEIIEMLKKVETENVKKDMAAAWMAILEKLQNEALSRIDAGEIQKMF